MRNRWNASRLCGFYAVTPDLADTGLLLAKTRAALAGGVRLVLPVVAIGGITLGKAGDLIHAGANAIAVISALFDVSDISTAARSFCQLFQVTTI